MPHDGAKSFSRKRGRGDLTSTDSIEKDLTSRDKRTEFRWEKKDEKIDQSENRSDPTHGIKHPNPNIYFLSH